MIEVFFPICNLTWLGKIYSPPRGEGSNRRNESTIVISIFIDAIDTFVIQLTVDDGKLFPLKGKLHFVTIKCSI